MFNVKREVKARNLKKDNTQGIKSKTLRGAVRDSKKKINKKEGKTVF